MEMNKWNNHELGAALVEALGLPKRTTSLEISMKPHAPLRVRCEYLPDQMTADGAERMIAEFKQVKLECVRPADSIDEQITNARRRLHASIDAACLKAQIELRRQAINAYMRVLVRHEVRSVVDSFFSISASAEKAIEGFKDLGAMINNLKRGRHA